MGLRLFGMNQNHANAKQLNQWLNMSEKTHKNRTETQQTLKKLKLRQWMSETRSREIKPIVINTNDMISQNTGFPIDKKSIQLIESMKSLNFPQMSSIEVFSSIGRRFLAPIQFELAVIHRKNSDHSFDSLFRFYIFDLFNKPMFDWCFEFLFQSKVANKSNFNRISYNL